MGSSTGGNIVVDLACRYPDLVKAAIIIDSAMFFSSQTRKRIREYQTKVAKEDIGLVRAEILKDSCLPTDKCQDIMRDAYNAAPTAVQVYSNGTS